MRNNIYIERLDNSQLQILDSENYDDIMFLVQETFRNVIADLIFNRDLELDFLKKFVQVKIKQKMGIDSTVIIYTKDSVKVVDNGVSSTLSK